MMCVALRAVSTIICIYSFICVYTLYFSSLIFSVFFTAGQPREFKHKISEQNASMIQSVLEWGLLKNGPCLLNTFPRPDFSIQVKTFHYRLRFVHVTTIQLKSNNIVSSVTGPGHRVSCFYCGLKLQNLKDSVFICTKHIEYNPYCIYVVQKEPKKVIVK